MSKILKLIIPLLGGGIKKTDLSEKCGFVEAYDSDINRPQYEDCVFLMYKPELTKTEHKLRHERFKNLPNLYKWRRVNIKSKTFILYCFKITNMEAKSVLRDRNPEISNKENKFKILRFWKDDVEILRHLVCDDKWNKEKLSTVPEEDYDLTFEDVYQIEKGRATMQFYLLFFSWNL